LLAKTVDVASDEPKSEPKPSALVDVAQLKEAVTSCVKEVMQEMEAKKRRQPESRHHRHTILQYIDRVNQVIGLRLWVEEAPVLSGQGRHMGRLLVAIEVQDLDCPVLHRIRLGCAIIVDAEDTWPEIVGEVRLPPHLMRRQLRRNRLQTMAQARYIRR